MPPKPYRLINFEREYAQTGEIPEDTSYRAHELRGRIQEKADLIDSRIDSLWNDVSFISLLDDVNLHAYRSPHELGRTFGAITADLVEGDNVYGVDSQAQFLAGALEGYNEKSVSPLQDHRVQVRQEFATDVIEEAQSAALQQSREAAEMEWDTFEAIQLRDRKFNKAREYVRDILREFTLPDSQWIVSEVVYSLIESPPAFPFEHKDWDPTDDLHRRIILFTVAEKRLVERQILRDIISEILPRLRVEWRSRSPWEIRELISTSEDRPVHIDSLVRKLGKADVTVAVVRDMAGDKDHRGKNLNLVFDDYPILAESKTNQWDTTKFGAILEDWIFGDGLGISVPVNDQIEALEELGITVLRPSSQAVRP